MHKIHWHKNGMFCFTRRDKEFKATTKKLESNEDQTVKFLTSTCIYNAAGRKRTHVNLKPR